MDIFIFNDMEFDRITDGDKCGSNCPQLMGSCYTYCRAIQDKLKYEWNTSSGEWIYSRNKTCLNAESIYEVLS